MLKLCGPPTLCSMNEPNALLSLNVPLLLIVAPLENWIELLLAAVLPLQVVVPRPGVAADVQIALVGGGYIEGALMKSGELGFEGVDLELVDSNNKVAGTARTDFDGFFLFERVAYGSYTLRVSANSAAAAKIGADLGLKVVIDGKHTVVRVGSIQPRPPVHLASTGPPTARPPTQRPSS